MTIYGTYCDGECRPSTPSKTWLYGSTCFQENERDWGGKIHNVIVYQNMYNYTVTAILPALNNENMYLPIECDRNENFFHPKPIYSVNIQTLSYAHHMHRQCT